MFSEPYQQVFPEPMFGTSADDFFHFDTNVVGNLMYQHFPQYNTYFWNGVLSTYGGDDTVQINPDRKPSNWSAASSNWELTLHGGGGEDALDFSITTIPMKIHLSHGYAHGKVVTDAHIFTLSSFENAMGGSGNDLIYGSGKDNYLYGGWGDDEFWASHGDDVVIGGDGDDEIHGENGADILIGGEGRDTIFGGNGDDNIQGGNGFDQISGGDGDDTLSGGNSKDVIQGGEGDDTISGGNGNDTLIGNNGDDTIFGGNGNDALSGGNGNDTLNGGAGKDFMIGGDGADEFNGGGGDDTIYGGSGFDTAVFNTRTNVSVSLQSGIAVSGGLGNDELVNIEGITTGEGNDLVIGDAASNFLALGAGDDTSHGLEGNDLIIGYAGNDLIFGGLGKDKLYGGSNDDVLQGDEAHDALWGESGNDKLFGGSGNDQLNGGSGDDTLNGGTGNNKLNAGSGDDFIFSVNAVDKITTGSGADVIHWGESIGGLDSVQDFNLFQDKISFDNGIFDDILLSKDIEDVFVALQVGQNSLLAAILPDPSGAPGDTTLEHIALFGNTNAAIMNQRIADGSIFPAIDIDVHTEDWQFEMGAQYALDTFDFV